MASLWVCAVWAQQEESEGRALTPGLLPLGRAAPPTPPARSAPGPCRLTRRASSWCSVQVSMPPSSFTSLWEVRAKPVSGRTRTGQCRKADADNGRLGSRSGPKAARSQLCAQNKYVQKRKPYLHLAGNKGLEGNISMINRLHLWWCDCR